MNWRRRRGDDGETVESLLDDLDGVVEGYESAVETGGNGDDHLAFAADITEAEESAESAGDRADELEMEDCPEMFEAEADSIGDFARARGARCGG